ncbi:MAG: Fe-S cluster assembly protein SufD [Immundisolibacteraceae bacterium]|nr:Fe-S cluster assembly protein SufD [Immundisolibacteraceae bacterium]
MAASQTNQQLTDRYDQQLVAHQAQLPGDGAVRQHAIKQLTAGGLPNRKTERWRYTRLNRVLKQDFGPSHQSAANKDDIDSLVSELTNQLGAQESALLVFDQGSFRADLSQVSDLGGIEFLPLGEALSCGAVKLAESRDGTARAFDQLNTALVADGSWLKIPAGKQPKITILVLAGAAHEQTNYWRLVVDAQSLSEAEIDIIYLGNSDDQAYHSNNFIDLQLSAGARLVVNQIQLQSQQAFHVAAMQVTCQRDSFFRGHLLALGADLARDDVDVYLAETGASVQIDGLQLTGGSQHADLHLTVEHQAPYCNSHVTHHGLFSDHGRGVFNGRVHVFEGADGTDSEMQSKNLLLSERAEIDSKPELEIYADDVKCSHGCTVGDLDHDQLFYLRSRGLAEPQARALLLHAFAAASFSEFAGPWADYVARHVNQKLDQLSHD